MKKKRNKKSGPIARPAFLIATAKRYLLVPPVLGVVGVGALVVLEPLVLGLVELEEPELMPPELDDPELVPPELEVPPAAPLLLLKKSSHSERLICPSWFLSILLKSSCETCICSPADEAPADEDLSCVDEDVPPAADDVPPVDDDGVLLCDVDGEALEPELDLLFASSA
jgi:hypothetical protein